MQKLLFTEYEFDIFMISSIRIEGAGQFLARIEFEFGPVSLLILGRESDKDLLRLQKYNIFFFAW